MKKLKLPVIRGSQGEPRTLSMDDYLEFIGKKENAAV